MSKLSDCWATPYTLFKEIEKEFGPFDLDVCTTIDNAKCMNFMHKYKIGQIYRNPYGICFKLITIYENKSPNQVEFLRLSDGFRTFPDVLDAEWMKLLTKIEIAFYVKEKNDL